MRTTSPQNDSDYRRLVLKALTQLRCGECMQPFDPHEFVLLQRRGDLWVLRNHCRHCDTTAHIIVVIQTATDREAVTDLTTDEIEVAGARAAITADDVLDVHVLLQEFDGDLEKLFSA